MNKQFKPMLVAVMASAMLMAGCYSSNIMHTPHHQHPATHNPYPATHHQSHNPYPATHHQSHNHHSNHKANLKKFDCQEIGLSVLIDQRNTDQIVLTVEEPAAKPTTMMIAPSGSGTRYVSNHGLWGYGGEWHESGAVAVFSYKGIHGNSAETICHPVA